MNFIFLYKLDPKNWEHICVRKVLELVTLLKHRFSKKEPETYMNELFRPYLFMKNNLFSE